MQSASGELAPFDDILGVRPTSRCPHRRRRTQSCGWLPFDARAVDALATHTYKWMMSPRAASLLVLRPEFANGCDHSPPAGSPATIRTPATTGSRCAWPRTPAASIRRQPGSPGSAPNPRLEVIEKLGVENIRDHDVRLANRLREGLELEPSNSAIVSVDIDDAERKLERAGIRAGIPAGRIRLSCHVYTTDHDVDEVLTTLTSP